MKCIRNLAFGVFAWGLLFSPLDSVRAADPYRLNHAVVPTLESITLHLNADSSNYFGSVRIELYANQPCDSFRFHAEQIAFDKMVLTGKEGAIAATYSNGPRGIITLHCTKALSAQSSYVLEIAFHNAFNQQAISLYKVATGGHAYAFTQFEAQYARQAFPCWDEPEFKIPFQLTLVIPKNHKGISNTPVEKETEDKINKTVVFEKTPPLPSYLIAFATGPFEFVDIPGLSVPGRVVTVQGQSHLTGEAVAMAPPILKALEQYFDRKYPFKKLDLIAVPEYAFGAMENPGAITFLDHLLLIDSKMAQFNQRYNLASVLAHEMAHMWFGDLVTMRWWDDTWLNESFASWMGSKITDDVYPVFKNSLSDIGSKGFAMRTDARPTAQAVRRDVSALVEPESVVFDELTYNKGQAILSMIENWLGRDTFRKGILDYLQTHAWKNADVQDLWKALSNVSKKDVGQLMSPFLDKAGVPLVRIESVDANHIRIHQKRFLNYGTDMTSDQLWNLPLTLKYADTVRTYTQDIFLTQGDTVIQTQNQKPLLWIYPNANESGYCRWTVSSTMFNNLSKASKSVLSLPERIGFINNISALVDGGMIAGDACLQSIAQVADDAQAEVCDAAIIPVYRAKALFIAEDLEEPFARYIQATFRPVLNHFGSSKKNGEDVFIGSFRESLIRLLGDAGKDKSIIRLADSLAEAYMTNPSSIDPNLSETVLELHAMSGGMPLFERYKKQFESAANPAEREKYVNCLGSFRDSAVVEKLYTYALSDSVRPQEVFGVIPKYDKYHGRNLEWLSKNYDAVIRKIPSVFVGSLPFFTVAMTEESLEKARLFFFDPARKSPDLEKTFDRLSDNIHKTLKVREKESKNVKDYLKQF